MKLSLSQMCYTQPSMVILILLRQDRKINLYISQSMDANKVRRVFTTGNDMCSEKNLHNKI